MKNIMIHFVVYVKQIVFNPVDRKVLCFLLKENLVSQTKPNPKNEIRPEILKTKTNLKHILNLKLNKTEDQ